VPIVNIQQEQEWLGGIIRGDETAFAALFGAYRNRIYGIALRLTSSEMLAEEITQDVFLKLWLRREKLSEVEHFRAYLFTITRNHVFDALKAMARTLHLTGEPGADWPDRQSATEDLLVNKEYEAVLREAVDRLPERQREVYRLIREQGWKREQVAKQLEISPETVKVHLKKAVQSIRAFTIARLDLYIARALFDALHSYK
jgi:RNA polymerase sigma-70 factor (family 1)